MRALLLKAFILVVALSTAVACSDSKKKNGGSRPSIGNKGSGIDSEEKVKKSKKDKKEEAVQEDVDGDEVEVVEGEERRRESDSEIDVGEVIVTDGKSDGTNSNVIITSQGPSGVVTTGAREDGTGRQFIDIVNDGILAQMKAAMDSEKDERLRLASKDLSRTIRRVGVHASAETKEAVVRLGISVGQGKPLVNTILRGTLDGQLVAQLREQAVTANDNYVFTGRISCLDGNCRNTLLVIEQWGDLNNDGKLEICKRAYLVHRQGPAKVFVEDDSLNRYLNKQGTTTGFNDFMAYMYNTVDLNEIFTKTGSMPQERNFPYARNLKLRTWTVAYGASEYVADFMEAWRSLEEIGQRQDHRSLGFRGFLYNNAGCVRVEVGSVTTDQYADNHEMIIFEGSMASKLSQVLQVSNNDSGRINLEVHYQGDTQTTSLRLQSLIDPVTLR